MKKIRIIVIEDNRLLREGIAALLKKQVDINLVDSAGDGKNIDKLIQKQNPEIVLLDLGLRNSSSLNQVKLVRNKFPSVKIIMMDLIPMQEDVFEFVQSGVSGFIVKDATVTDFLKTIRSVSKGQKVLPPNLTGSLFSQIVEHAVNGLKPSVFRDSILMTRREKEVIKLISEGNSNKEIAQTLHLSTYTVKSHVHNILEKLALSTRVQIAKYLHDSEKTNSPANHISLIDD
jgi:DNA-binding NarL/FixJ family response regulator